MQRAVPTLAIDRSRSRPARGWLLVPVLGGAGKGGTDPPGRPLYACLALASGEREREGRGDGKTNKQTNIPLVAAAPGAGRGQSRNDARVGGRTTCRPPPPPPPPTVRSCMRADGTGRRRRVPVCVRSWSWTVTLACSLCFCCASRPAPGTDTRSSLLFSRSSVAGALLGSWIYRRGNESFALVDALRFRRSRFRSIDGELQLRRPSLSNHASYVLATSCVLVPLSSAT